MGIIMIIWWMAGIYGATAWRINVCHPAHIEKSFEIQGVKKCRRNEIEKIETCIADIYDPNVRKFKIQAIRCQEKLEHYESYWYLLGYKKHTMLGTELKGPSPEECRTWWLRKQAAGVGKLRQISKNAYASSVPKQIHYMYVQLYRSAIKKCLPANYKHHI